MPSSSGSGRVTSIIASDSASNAMAASLVRGWTSVCCPIATLSPGSLIG
ncbi:MAG: hypothetical protein WDN66_00165 [Candidatus Saccharibacteria bacterium]